MCGIAGFSGEVDPVFLDQANDIQAHRGPDNAGKWFDSFSKTGLAHRRLSIIDLSKNANQPMLDHSKKLVLTYNGEIYNFQKLKKELKSKGYVFHTNSDSEVLLQLYKEYGYKLLDKLEGIYAFAIFDKDKQELFIARDELGVKPLYYAELNNSFTFASELKALLKNRSLQKNLSPEAIHYYISYLWCPAPLTILKEVKKLEPGHALIIKNGKINRKWQFYDIPYKRDYFQANEEDIALELAKKLKETVHKQMVSDVTVGSFLSGGLDSSAIVAFAREKSLKQKLDCFTIGFQNNAKEFDGFAEDLPYAQKVAKQLDISLHTINVGPDMIDRVEDMIFHLDEPQADPAPLNALFICELAKKKGIKVLLSGAGGDDIFSGYRRHLALDLEKYWSWLPKAGRKILKIASSQFKQNSSFGRRLSKAFRYSDLNNNERLASYFLWMEENLQKKLYSNDFQHSLKSIHSLSPLIHSLNNLPQNIAPLNKMLYLESKHFLCDHNLNYTDKMAMACGVEVRVPFLDKELIKFATKIPPSLKVKNGVLKYILKKSMEPYLDHNIIYRPKSGFGAPLRGWLHNELKDATYDLLSPASIKKRGLFDVLRVQNLLKDDKEGKIDASYSIFSLMCIEWWQRIFLDE